MNLPKEITVIVHRTNQGLWAKVKEFPHCYTQAKNYSELIKMLNDAIFSYAGISEKERKGFYIPKSLAEELQRKKWGKFFEELQRKQALKGRSTEKYTAAPYGV